MASKKGKITKNQISDNFDLDDDLLFDDINFDIDPFKDDRTPKVKIKDGLIKGVKSKASEPTFVKGLLRDLLPKGYGDTLDLSEKVASSIAQVYRESADQVRPAIRDFKRVSAKLVPKDSKLVPKNIKDILQRWEEESKSTTSSSGLSPADQRSMAIAQELGEIFKEQIVQDKVNSAEQAAKDRIKDSIELTRHKDLFGVLNQSNMSLQRMAQYQTTINLQYQKKSLELQHRQLFALYDLLAQSKATHSLQAESFQNIAKNTALPDWKKIKLSEFAHQSAFEKFTGALGSGLMPGANEYIDLTAKKIKSRFMGSLKSNVADFRSGLTEAESAKAMMGSAGDGMMPDKYETGAELVGSEATESLGSWAAKKLKDPLQKRFPSIVTTGDRLENFNENFVSSAERFRKSDKWRTSSGPLAWLMSNIQDLLPSMQKDTSFNRITSRDLNAIHPFTIKTNRSITDVIPGYLARILREVQIIRTGNDKIELTLYDQDKGLFSNESKITRMIASKIFSARESRRTRDIMDPIIQEIDPDGKLSDAERHNLAKAILKNKTEYRDLSSGLEGGTRSILEKKLSDTQADPRKNLIWSRRLNSLVQGASDSRSTIEQLIAQGNYEELLNLGIITMDGDQYVLNTDLIYEMQLGKDPYSEYASKRGISGTDAQHIDTPIAQTDVRGKTAKFMTKSMRRKAAKARRAVRNFKGAAGGAFGGKLGILGGVGMSALDAQQNPPDALGEQIANEAQAQQEQKQILRLRDRMRKTGKGLRAALARVRHRLKRKWKDLYVAGESEPRIIDDKLTAGHYVDANTSEPITSVDNISGPVLDISENRIVLRTQELPRTVVRDVEGNTTILEDKTIESAKKILGEKNVNDALSGFNKLRKSVKDGYKNFKQSILNEWVEVYVAAETEPRLTADKMKNGHYSDANSLQVLVTIHDIEGGVLDNKLVKSVLLASELDKAIVKLHSGEMIPLEKYIKKSLSYKIAGKNNNNSFIKSVFEKARSEINKNIADKMNTIQDIWVRGETQEPRIRADKIRQGKYIDQTTGKPVFSPSDINGPVLDENGKVVIASEDIPNLVVWDIESRSWAPLRKLGRLLKSIGSGIGWYYKKIGIPATIYNFKMMAKAARVITNFTRSLWGSGPYSVKDVYVGREKEPRLYATRLRQGEYLDMGSGRPIFHQNDIKGAVIDSSGEIKISTEDLPNLQVYDSVFKIFNPLKIPMYIIKAATKAATWGMKKGFKATMFLSKKLLSGATSVIGSVARKFKKPKDVYVKGEANARLSATYMKEGRYVSGNTGKTIELPSDIDGPVWDAIEQTEVINSQDLARGLTDFSGKPIKTSFMDKVANVAGKLNKFFSMRRKFTGTGNFKPVSGASNKVMDPAITAQQETVSTLKDIKGLFEKYFKKDKVSGDADGDGYRDNSWQDILQKRKAAKAAAAGKQKPVGAKTNDRKSDAGLFSMIAGALDAITGFIGGFGKLLGGAGILGKVGSMLGLGASAVTAAGATGAAATTVSAAATGAAAATTGGLGAAALAMMTNPITLGVLGAAVVGYGAYRGYKAIKKWMAQPTALEKIRYVQYGFKADNADKFSQVIELENYLKRYTKVTGDGADLDDGNIDIKEIMSMFYMNPELDDERTQFGVWYVKRFKPVYLTHVSAVNMMEGHIDLSKINDFSKEKKLQYIEAVKFPSGPYTITRLPTVDKSIPATNATDVENIIKAAIAQYSKLTEDKAKSALSGNTAPTVPKTDPITGKTVQPEDDPKSKDKLPGSNTSSSSTASLGSGTNNYNALDIVRFKTYGIVELEASKINALTALEKVVSKKVSYSSKKATMRANALEILKEVTTYFGVANLLGEHSSRWVRWFNERFLPVYLNYYSLYSQVTNKAPDATNSGLLKPNEQLDIARAISATNGVWRVTHSPWLDYALNTDPNTIRDNIALLQDTANKVTVPDKTAPTTSQTKTDDSPYRSQTMKDSDARTEASTNAATASTYVMPRRADAVNTRSDSSTSNIPRSDDAATSSTYVMPGAQRATGPAAELLDYIGQKEARGNYNILVGGRVEPALTNMTIREVLEYQRGMIARGHESTAVGKYQIIRGTLKELTDKGYASLDERFTPEVQDRLAYGLLRRRKIEAYMSGKITADDFMDNLSKEWASLPSSSGRSYYAGVGSNKSSGTRDALLAVLPPTSNAAPGGESVTTAAAQVDNSGMQKASYSPTARPAAMAQKATAAANESVASQTVGYNPVRAPSNSANDNVLSSKVMQKTEGILQDSLEVQKQMLEVMRKIHEKITGSQTQESEKPNQPQGQQTAQYSVPKAPVSMRRS